MEFKLFESIDEMKNTLVNNKPRLVKAGAKNICIVRQDEDLIAFENECPHMGESLHKGLINFQNEIACPLHSYRFNILSGECNQRECAPLKFIKVKRKNKVVLDL